MEHLFSSVTQRTIMLGRENFYNFGSKNFFNFCFRKVLAGGMLRNSFCTLLRQKEVRNFVGANSTVLLATFLIFEFRGKIFWKPKIKKNLFEGQKFALFLKYKKLSILGVTKSTKKTIFVISKVRKKIFLEASSVCRNPRQLLQILNCAKRKHRFDFAIGAVLVGEKQFNSLIGVSMLNALCKHELRLLLPYMKLFFICDHEIKIFLPKRHIKLVYILP